jgi:Ca2+-binding EF-hand superfamily protein
MARDEQRRELIDKVARLVADRFGNDHHKAFGHYDRDGDEAISRDELLELLADAGVGNRFTRGWWADGILAELDVSKDGKVGLAELAGIL